MSNITNFRGYILGLKKEEEERTGRRGGSNKYCIVKFRYNVDVDIYSDVNYVTSSGAANSGTILSERKVAHKIDYDAWLALLKNKKEANEMLKTLAKEDGVDAVFSGKKILRVKKYETTGVIYEIPEEK